MMMDEDNDRLDSISSMVHDVLFVGDPSDKVRIDKLACALRDLVDYLRMEND